MIVQTSESVRHLVGRLERGETIHESLLALARTHHIRAASFTALGALDRAALVEYDQQGKVYRTPRNFEGALEVLSCVGNLSLKDGEPFAHVHVAVSRDTDNGIEVLGGHLIAARVFALEFALTVYDDITLERVLDPATGLSLWCPQEGSAPTRDRAQDRVGERSALTPPVQTRAHSPAHGVAAVGPSPAAPNAPRTLADAARQLEAMPPRPESYRVSDPGPEITARDLLQHPQWGEVQVEKESEPGRFMIRLPSGSVRSISLDVFEVVPRPEKNGQRVFLLRPRKR